MTTREQIIAAAKEVGAYRYINRAAKDEPTHTFTIEQLIAFYAIAFEAGCRAERAECAKVCEMEAGDPHNLPAAIVARRCSDAIRARGESK